MTATSFLSNQDRVWHDLPSARHGVYAGSFDPITPGHLNVIERAASLFERVTVLVAVNPQKVPWFSVAERVEQIRQVTRSIPQVVVRHTEGYVARFAAEHGAGFLIRGVRSKTDAAEELKLAHLNRKVAPEVETLFVPCRRDLSMVSSSRLKRLAEAHLQAETTQKSAREHAAPPRGTHLDLDLDAASQTRDEQARPQHAPPRDAPLQTKSPLDSECLFEIRDALLSRAALLAERANLEDAEKRGGS